MYDDEQVAAREMLRIDRDNAAAHYVLGVVKGMLGSGAKDSTARKMYDEEALGYFRRASQLDSNYTLAKIGETLILLRNNLAKEANKIIKEVNEMRAIFVEKDYYYMACYYAWAGELQLALENLTDSFEKASPSKRAELLETGQFDPDLEPLRGNDEFHKIITKYQLTLK